MSKNTCWVISILLNLLRLVLWPRIQPTWVSVPWALGKAVCSGVTGWDVWPTWSRSAGVGSSPSVPAFCPMASSVTEMGVAQSPTGAVGRLFSPASPIRFYFTCFAALLSDTHALRVPTSLGDWLTTIQHPFPSPSFLCSEVYFIQCHVVLILFAKYPSLCSLTFNLPVLLSLKWGSCQFLTYFASLRALSVCGRLCSVWYRCVRASICVCHLTFVLFVLSVFHFCRLFPACLWITWAIFRIFFWFIYKVLKIILLCMFFVYFFSVFLQMLLYVWGTYHSLLVSPPYSSVKTRALTSFTTFIYDVTVLFPPHQSVVKFCFDCQKQLRKLRRRKACCVYTFLFPMFFLPSRCPSPSLGRFL